MNLAQKIAKASAAIGGKLKADARNQEQKYNYISADKILSVCGQALADVGVTVFPSVVGDVMDIFDRGNNKVRYDATVTFMMHVSDGETSVDLPWIGRGSDYTVPDKALYKAITSGHKYFVAKLFSIGEGNEDSEHETAETSAPQSAAPATNGNGHKPKPATGNLSAQLVENLRKREADSTARASEAQYRFAVGVLNKLTQDDGHKLILNHICEREVDSENPCGNGVSKYVIDYAREEATKKEKEAGNNTNPTYNAAVADTFRQLWRQLQEDAGQTDIWEGAGPHDTEEAEPEPVF